MAQNSNLVDESLYSRQLYAIGLDAMKSIVSSKILILNLTPLAVEICKNIILCGCGTLTLADADNIISEKDLGLNYYICEKDFGKKRSDIMGKRMQELNKNVIVNKYSGIVNEKICSKYDLIIFVDPQFTEENFKLNEFCRQKNIKTIYTSTNGIYGFIFCDFNNFITTDINGEKLRSGIIVDISEDIITTDKVHDLESDVNIQIAENIYKIIKVIDRFKIKIDKSISKDFIGKSYTEIKSKVEIKFNSLRESISNPEFVITDFAKMDKPQLLHDINVKIRQNIQTPELEQTDLYKKILKSYGGNIVALNSVIGGIVAHNITAGICGKYQPIKQWLYFDIEELYDDNTNYDWKYSPIYANQVKVIGKKLQSEINKFKLFIVGSGAIGCEHLKNFSMMGISDITITDLDTIEKSNLNRQFLFRNSDIGKYKSQVAAEKAMKMNPKVNILAKLNKVGIETENIFNNKFYKNIDMIVNALDNVNARNYMDQQAINYNLPLLESGTLGLKGNVQVVIPGLTESYQSSTDQVEESIPICTLKNFPYESSHCIQWAREQFQNLFIVPFETLKQFLTNSEEKLNKLTPTELIDAYTNLEFFANLNEVTIMNKIFNSAMTFFNVNFIQKINDLREQYPIDHITNDGEKFWSKTRRFPSMLSFNKTDDTIFNFVKAYTEIMTEILNLDKTDMNDKITEFLNSYCMPKLESKFKFGATEEEEKKLKEHELLNIDYEEIKKNIIQIITNTDKLKFSVIEFEKDSDTNFHIDFITTISNFRARNYSIPETSKFETKGIAGKIIPALATTTAVVSGLVSIELMKYIKYKNELAIDKFKNTFVSLGITFIGSSEPIACPTKKIGKLDINLWTSLQFNDDTITNLIEKFKTEYEVNITNIMYQDKILFSNFMNKTKRDEISKKTISEIISSKENINLAVNIEDINNDDENEIINVTLIS